MFRFWRRVGLGSGTTLNLSKGALSLSLGKRGSRLTLGTRGIRGSLGLTGTGMFLTGSTGEGRSRVTRLTTKMRQALLLLPMYEDDWKRRVHGNTRKALIRRDLVERDGACPQLLVRKRT